MSIIALVVLFAIKCKYWLQLETKKGVHLQKLNKRAKVLIYFHCYNLIVVKQWKARALHWIVCWIYYVLKFMLPFVSSLRDIIG